MFKSFAVALAVFAVSANAWGGYRSHGPGHGKRSAHGHGGIETYGVPAQTKVPKRPGNPFHPGAPTYDESYDVPA